MTETTTPCSTRNKYNEADLETAWHRKSLVETYTNLMTNLGLTPRDAVARMWSQGIRVSRSTIRRYKEAYDSKGITGLLPGRSTGRPRKDKFSEKELAALVANYAITNRTEDGGSVPEAVRMSIRKGEISEEKGNELLERERTGRIVTPATANDITLPASVIHQLRNPKEAALDYLNAPGTMMWVTDQLTGEKSPVRVGDILEADDATVNFFVCVPWQIGGDPCSEKFGVRVARFQWLVTIDRGSRFVPGWSYTMRPKSSYRAEDIVSMFHGVFRQHGIWKRLCLERGVWESHLVSNMIANVGTERMTAWSPHQKPYIEGLFNLMWTKLSDLPGQVGRFAGDELAAEQIAMSCRRGATDPRKHFPMLAHVLASFERVVNERNQLIVKSENYGSWVPAERFDAQLPEARELGRLRPLPEEAAWMFSPCVKVWTVRGSQIGGRIPVMEGQGIRYDFQAPWLHEFNGQEVKAHFDHRTGTTATVTLVNDFRCHKAGDVLGDAVMTNFTANQLRRSLGWCDAADMGLQLRKAVHTAMRQEVRTALPDGRPGLAITQIHDGDNRTMRVERTGDAPEQVTTKEPAVPRTPRVQPVEVPWSRRQFLEEETPVSSS